jgi:integrase
MTDWDSDDLIECLEDRLSEPRLSKRSKGLILTAYVPFLRFLTAKLGLSPVSVKGIRIDYVTGAGQWALISPHAIDKVIRQLRRDADRRLRQAGLVLSLGYYGGLRTGDIKNLTLDDIVFNDRLPDLDIEICRGKSRNARRRLSFHALAPDHIQSLIRESWVDRLSEFPNRTILSKIPLLGPESRIESYEFASIARLARYVLKQAFGDDANIHTLRHCFCSNLVIRWYSLRHPDILQDLRDASHDIYQPELQDQLDRFFSVMPYEDGEIRPYDLISMIKLTGHASPETLFQYYVHTFGVIQSHAMRSCHSLIENIEVQASDIALLLPRMRSSKSRANIANKTLGGLADYLLTQGLTRAEFTSVLPDTQPEMPN